MAAVSGRWLSVLRDRGYEPGEVLGSGMEGTVIALGGGRVAKIWGARAPSELRDLQRFYRAVRESQAR